MMNGFINMNKPAGMSSAAVVGTLKRLTGVRRIGHAGTLDPEAAGVLPIMLGRATRLFDYLVDKEKEYRTVCAFGTATDTQDATGTPLETGVDYPDLARVAAALPSLTGDISQRPSVYSAIKVGGKPLYARARSGEQVEAPERTVHVESIEVLGEEPGHGVALRIVCGRGTYIRSICHDLGRLCGCPAHMRSLVRTRSGFFTLENAVTPEEARARAEAGTLGELLVPMDVPLRHIPAMRAPAGLDRRVDAGARLPLDRMEGEPPAEGGAVRIYLGECFRGIAVRDGDELSWRVQIPREDSAEGEAWAAAEGEPEGKE